MVEVLTLAAPAPVESPVNEGRLLLLLAMVEAIWIAGIGYAISLIP